MSPAIPQGIYGTSRLAGGFAQISAEAPLPRYATESADPSRLVAPRSSREPYQQRRPYFDYGVEGGDALCPVQEGGVHADEGFEPHLPGLAFRRRDALVGEADRYRVDDRLLVGEGRGVGEHDARYGFSVQSTVRPEDGGAEAPEDGVPGELHRLVPQGVYVDAGPAPPLEYRRDGVLSRAIAAGQA